MNIASVLSFLQSYSPILLPASVWLVGLLIRHLPSKRFAKLQTIAASVVPAIEQQANGSYTNEQKYDAAAQGVSLLAAKFGYRVNDAEMKLLIEGAVAGFKNLAVSTSAAPSSDSAVAQDSPTQPVEPVAGAV